jgi:hypothetical protein
MSDVFTAAPSEFGSNGESMVTWFASKYGLERDAAIGGLTEFVNGRGQPTHALFVAFPELAALYFKALGNKSV